MPQSPTPPAKNAGDSHRIQVQPKDCVHCSDESQSLDNVPAPAFVARSTTSLSLLQTSPRRPHEVASSNRKNASPAYLARDRTPSPSDRSDSVLIPVHAPSSAILPSVVSFLKIDASRRRKQDGVKISL